MSPPATVVIGNHTQGLGIVRSAAAAGGAVWVVNDKSLSLARYSRHLTGYRRIPHGTLLNLSQPKSAAVLRDALLELPLSGMSAIFGVNEDVNRFIHQHRKELRGRFVIPEVRLETIYDKYVFNTLVPKPAQIDTRLANEVDWTAAAAGNFLLKGRVGNAFRELTGQKAICLKDMPSSNREQLFTQLPADQVVLQEIIETQSPVRSVCSFSVDGQIRAWFGYDKLRQHPNRFGTGTYLGSVAVDELKPVAEAILQKLNYTGLSEIEFIHEPVTQTYRVIEMNPRAWKSVHFATQCGQNLVALYLKHLAGERVDTGGRYRHGGYWADLATDLPQMLRERKLSGYHRGFFECTWESSDPLPALVLWTGFPLIALENFWAARFGKPGKSDHKRV